MLKQLFSSAVRAEVLSLLLNAPEEKFYVREIAKLLEKNPSAVKRELDNLEKMGIVTSEKVANLKYFRSDPDSPLYSELKSLITKSLGIAGNLKTALRNSGASRAFIFGPYAEGQDVKTVSLFVTGPQQPDEKALKKVARHFGYRLDMVFMEEDEYRHKKKRREKSLRLILAERRIPLLGRV